MTPLSTIEHHRVTEKSRATSACNSAGKATGAAGIDFRRECSCPRASDRVGRASKPGKKGEPPLLAERFTFHDLRAKSASDSASDQDAADRLGHGDVKLTRDTYRRLPRRAAALKILDNKA